ncbi:hypothetical protein V1477_008340 [Vespula maculifrons]|uniref:Uncharacterized protein n=1 Tax=Vespula maculifrons TaxID=7453 RepID=A0ABD2CCR3_VESMC
MARRFAPVSGVASYWFHGNFIGKLGFVSGSHDMRRGGTSFRASLWCRNKSYWSRGNFIGKLVFVNGSHDITRGGTIYYCFRENSCYIPGFLNGKHDKQRFIVPPLVISCDPLTNPNLQTNATPETGAKPRATSCHIMYSAYKFGFVVKLFSESIIHCATSLYIMLSAYKSGFVARVLSESIEHCATSCHIMLSAYKSRFVERVFSESIEHCATSLQIMLSAYKSRFVARVFSESIVPCATSCHIIESFHGINSTLCHLLSYHVIRLEIRVCSNNFLGTNTLLYASSWHIMCPAYKS